MSARDNLLVRIEGWTEQKLMNGNSYADWDNIDYSTGYDRGRKATLRELLDYIQELKGV